MADNYLEKKFEDLKNRGKIYQRRVRNSIDSLFKKNRSYRGYDSKYKVSLNELIKIIEINKLTPSARNQQVLRFKPIIENQAIEFTKKIKLGAALPELNLPFKGSEPNGYIIIYSTVPENKWVDIDLGISAQSMLLKAVDMGLNGICIGAFDKEFALSLIEDKRENLEPLLVIAIGKGNETIKLIQINEGDSHNYYREDGVHYVPKVQELIIK